MSSLAIVSDINVGRGRPVKISTEQVYEYLSDGEWHTTADIATAMDCAPETIRKRVKDLLDDSHLVIKGPRGVKLADDTALDTETIDEIGAMLKWVFAGVGSMAKHAVPVKKVMPQIRKSLPKTTRERDYLRSVMVKVTHLIDWESIDDLDVVG